MALIQRPIFHGTGVTHLGGVKTEEYGCHLFVINTDGSGLTQVTDDVYAYDVDISWSR